MYRTDEFKQYKNVAKYLFAPFTKGEGRFEIGKNNDNSVAFAHSKATKDVVMLKSIKNVSKGTSGMQAMN